MRYRVRFNTHKYADHSDRPRSDSIVFIASDPEEARNTLVIARERQQRGEHVLLPPGCKERYIGLIFDAEPVE